MIRGRRGSDSGGRAGLNLLDLVPHREVGWEVGQEGLVTLLRETPSVRGLKSLGRWLSAMMAPPRIRLDDVGSFAWLRMDGEVDVRDLVDLVRQEFEDDAEPVAQRLGHFVRLLRRERFVTLTGPDGGPL